jgi:hypothetical protein
MKAVQEVINGIKYKLIKRLRMLSVKSIVKIDRKSADYKISIALMASFVILALQYVVLIYFNILGLSEASIIQLISKVLVGITFAYALPVVLKRGGMKVFITYFIAIFIFILNFMMFPNNRSYLGEVSFNIFFICLPAFIYSMSIQDWVEFKKVMRKASFIVFVFGVILGGSFFLGVSSVRTYSMSLSYYMLLPSVIFLDELLDKFSLRIFIYTVISLMVILALGSRGAILCILVFVFLKIIRTESKLSYKRKLVYFTITGIIFLGYLFLNRILQSLYLFLLNVGVKSRSILLFMNDGIYLSGREDIYRTVVGEIIANPILGIGLAGDRSATGGDYAHNFFIEFIAGFGIIFGSLIIIIFIFYMIKNLATKELKIYNMTIIWICLGFVSLMVSGTYLTDFKFWVFLGFLLNRSIKMTLPNRNAQVENEDYAVGIRNQEVNNNGEKELYRKS